MREVKAIYGGEMSAHHYFRDFAYCDSGMIPWLLMAELLSKSDQSLASLIEGRFAAFPSSGEINFKVKDADSSITSVLENYRTEAKTLDEMDGVAIGMYKFNKQGGRILFDSIGRLLKNKNTSAWVSEALNIMSKYVNINIKTFRSLWADVDNLVDLKSANKIFKKMASK